MLFCGWYSETINAFYGFTKDVVLLCISKGLLKRKTWPKIMDKTIEGHQNG